MFGWFGRKAIYWKRQYDQLVQDQNRLHDKLKGKEAGRREWMRKSTNQATEIIGLRERVRLLERQLIKNNETPAIDMPRPGESATAYYRRRFGSTSNSVGANAQRAAIERASEFDSTRTGLMNNMVSDYASLAVLGSFSGTPITQPAPLDEPIRSGGGGDFGGAGASGSWESGSTDSSSSCSSSSDSGSCSTD